MISIPDIPNVSLVAFYGTKNLAFQSLIEFLQKKLSVTLQNKFESYSIEQIHATTIGCEGLNTEKGILSKWFLENRGEEKYIDLSEFINFLRQSNFLPIQIEIGGYNPAIDYGFFSKNKHPFERSFQFQGDFAVLMGWSRKNRQISLDLDRFRLKCQNFNLLHKYHKQLDSVDNDCYMRIGALKEKLSDEEIQAIEREIRDSLMAIAPISLSIDTNSLKFIGYQSLSPSPDTTKVIALRDATVQKLETLYP